MKISRVPRIVGLSLMVLVACVAVVYAAYQRVADSAAPLAGFAPPGALLAIESPDFAGLLGSWNNSAEQRRWLAGDNYAAFSRSRLFDRLGQAQDEFAATAGLAPDSKFLQQIAGGQSLLAWYDIGNLEFLYITRLPHGEAANTPLLKLRDKFEQRSVGADTFFVRSQSDPARTVAFAVKGDYLLLATREDLLADALQRMQTPSERSLLHDSWYASGVGAAAAKAGDLRMTLNLASIVPSPYFRSYWVQQNVTEMKQYRAAVSDLYRDAGNFREERVLIPVEDESKLVGVDLSGVLGFVPAGVGVYRASAVAGSDEVIEQLEDKVLARGAGVGGSEHVAPVADLGVAEVGDASDLEERIDEPLVVKAARGEELGSLREVVGAVQPVAMMVFSTGKSADVGVFQGVHSGVVIEGATAWDEVGLERSVGAVLARRLTVGGLSWSVRKDGGGSWDVLDGAYPLAFAVRGKVWVVATDEATLRQMLGANRGGGARVARVVAGVDFGSEREPFLRLTSLLDQPAGQEPAFFSGNVGSLVGVFGDLRTETFTESADAQVVRQTVVYAFGKD